MPGKRTPRCRCAPASWTPPRKEPWESQLSQGRSSFLLYWVGARRWRARPGGPMPTEFVRMTRDQYLACSKKDLAAMARAQGIAGSRSMRKEELVAALE